MNQETDDLDIMITSSVLEAIANESLIEDTANMVDELNKAVEILKAVRDKHENTNLHIVESRTIMNAEDLDKLINDKKTWIVTEFNNDTRTSMNHTPKPWTFIPLIDETNTLDELHNVICLGEQVIAQIYDSDNPVTDGNLIAAAPELLEACQMFLNVWLSGETNFSSERALKLGATMKSAVAKATGKQK